MPIKRRTFVASSIATAAAGTAALAGFSTSTFAQTFPARSISIVVGAAAGGPNDIVARLVSERLAQRLGVPVVIENKPGASGFIAAGDIKNAAPDGYRLLFTSTAIFAINPWLFKSLPYDPVKDFSNLALVAKIPQVLLVRPQLGVRTMQELVDWLRTHSNEAAYGSAGVGTPLHIAGELFLAKAGVRAVHSPYKGSSPAYSDLLSGRIQFIFDGVPGALSYIKGGQLLALAITGTNRLPLLANVPTMAEAGLKDAEVESWFGFAAPAATPKRVVDQLSAALQQVSQEPDLRSRFDELGAQTLSTNGAEMTAYVARDTERWHRLVNLSGVQPE